MYLQQSSKTKASSYASESLFKKYTSLNLMTCFFDKKKWTLNFYMYITLKNDNDGIRST